MPTPHPQLKTVIVVDDSKIQNQHAAEVCQDCGLQVLGVAYDGLHALELLKSMPSLPDLMIVDLDMPVMDGISLIQKLAETNQYSALLILSAREIALLSSVKTMVKAYGLPVVDALQKPLNSDELNAALTRYRQRVIPKAPLVHQPKVVVTVADIVHAIVNKEFVAYFQPKIFLKNGMIKGVEALVRWQHPEKGMIYPDDFIPMAEEHGLIHDITLQMLEYTLHWLDYWASYGLTLTVAINLSAGALTDLSLVEQISSMVEKAGVSPKQITLEITETAVMADVALSLTTLARLRLKGFGLSIDDYGTGFSSMQQLSRIPFTELKIDRSFVDGASESLQLEHMVNIAIDTARTMGLSCVAEGVETPADWQLLKDLGCDIAQGYLAAKPMPGEALIPWIKSEGKRLRDL
ncbi:EAL domain-containing response regulator [Chitinibacter sp. SCUT-21]|uniref:EAL domain-containing response regulator n=1 Tax=Chitinibacter sp. SCUT-21 TaxID=2970891 RepID=UPI0035A6A89B